MTYKNVSDQDLFIPMVGFVRAGETIETDLIIENANFEEVTPDKPQEPMKEEVN